MKFPPVKIVTAAPDEIFLELDMRHELEAFRDHFPEHPILPGVVQIEWVVKLAEKHLNLAPLSARAFQVKFRSIIRPGDVVSLFLQRDRAKNRLSFTYKSADEIMSSGIVKLGTTV